MAHFDSTRTVTPVTDASATGVGAICCQHDGTSERALSYASKTLNKARNYGATELELYDIVFAVEKFHCYVNDRCAVT